ncbi:hypothetical protein F2Q68_00019715 [Brassica cretica]|uniref:Uncharacterized protein n=1 Tax=Brassica cretica TaxID=69181 RepID=A0A8S9FSN0_BRACR|nr:hypothetical protein F2Q68_00019715 [Brassica cretica]
MPTVFLGCGLIGGSDTEETSSVVGNAEGKIATLQLVYMEKCNYLTVDFFKKLLRLRECPLFSSVVV